jgi:pyrroline-5-carboxylate reductase
MDDPALLWEDKRLGVIGAGNMAEALIRGVVGTELIAPGKILACDPNPERRLVFQSIGCQVADNPAAAAGMEVLLLSVKPQMVRDVLGDIRDRVKPGTLIISIMAGVKSSTIAGLLPGGMRIIRVMPNTPLLVGMGMAAVAKGVGAGGSDMQRVLALFEAAGRAIEVDESDMDAVTALSGSGPAYVFYFAEALIAAGKSLGLPAGVSHILAINTLRGAASMLALKDGDPADLRKKVTSPGGTTAAALDVFREGDLFGLVEKALAAAEKRGEELGKNA